MYLKQINLVNFKNYSEATVTFSPRINCFTGANGMGKTNLLDAIHYLSLCKGFTNAVDSQNIAFDQPFFMIQGSFVKSGREEEILVSVKRGQKKIVKRNKNEYEKLSEHIGEFPLVMIGPLDATLITGSSEQRRKFIDGIISQFDKEYLSRLISYNHVLQQRNAMLKQFAQARTFDSTLMEVMDEQLAAHGSYIYQARVVFLNEFIPVFGELYKKLSGDAEAVSVRYLSTVDSQNFLDVLKSNVRKDCAVEHTSAGTHRDDLELLLKDNEVKKYASQGQQKTYLLALKLAQYKYIAQKTGVKPLLLLDDVYDKLDNTRFEQLISLVSSDEFGQVFITDTSRDRIQKLFAGTTLPLKIFWVEEGKVTQIR